MAKINLTEEQASALMDLLEQSKKDENQNYKEKYEAEVKKTKDLTSKNEELVKKFETAKETKLTDEDRKKFKEIAGKI